MLFRFGEALAAAGFDSYSVDQAGYGESPRTCSVTNLMLETKEFERALGKVDVFTGHSMGGGVGEWSVREAGITESAPHAEDADPKRPRRVRRITVGCYFGGNWNRPATIPGTVMSSSSSSQRRA